MLEKEEDEEIEGVISPKSAMLQQDQSDSREQKKATKYSASCETHAVSIFVIDGYKIHVADYPDGTRVATCLDGRDKGYQAIGFNGAIIIESKKAEWQEIFY